MVYRRVESPIRKIVSWSGILLFFLMLVAPCTYYEIKIPLLVFLAICILFRKQPRSLLTINQPMIQWSLYYTLIGAFFVLWGLDDADKDSFFHVSMLYVVFPLGYMVLVLGLDEQLMIRLMKVIPWSIPAISVFLLIYLLGFTGKIGYFQPIAESFRMASNAGMKEGVSTVRTTTVSTLVFAAPFVLSLVLSGDNNSLVKNRKAVFWMILILAELAILVSGRRALFVVFLFSIGTHFVLSTWLPRKDFRIVTNRVPIIVSFLGIGLFLIAFYWLAKIEFDFGQYIQNIWVGVVTGGGEIRRLQAGSLLESWWESPVLGHGHGTSASFARNKEWRYELSYLALLMHTGVVGFLAYSAGIFWVFRRGLRIIRTGGANASITIALLNGLTAMLIAHCANPYFDTFDVMWPIFLPAAYINRKYFELSRNRAARSRVAPVSHIPQATAG